MPFCFSSLWQTFNQSNESNRTAAGEGTGALRTRTGKPGIHMGFGTPSVWTKNQYQFPSDSLVGVDICCTTTKPEPRQVPRDSPLAVDGYFVQQRNMIAISCFPLRHTVIDRTPLSYPPIHCHSHRIACLLPCILLIYEIPRPYQYPTHSIPVSIFYRVSTTLLLSTGTQLQCTTTQYTDPTPPAPSRPCPSLLVGDGISFIW